MLEFEISPYIIKTKPYYVKNMFGVLSILQINFDQV